MILQYKLYRVSNTYQVFSRDAAHFKQSFRKWVFQNLGKAQTDERRSRVDGSDLLLYQGNRGFIGFAQDETRVLLTHTVTSFSSSASLDVTYIYRDYSLSTIPFFLMVKLTQQPVG